MWIAGSIAISIIATGGASRKPRVADRVAEKLKLNISIDYMQGRIC
jgi:hypothetical protein